MPAELIAPGAGRALVVGRGQVLRIEQVRGRQVVDLNLFSLRDGRERLSQSRTRSMHGLSIGLGDSLWSAAPRERPLMTLIGDSAAARHDVSYPACSAFEYTCASGLPGFRNCADIQAESIRRFGLTPDDVHDPLNLWMESGASDQGQWWRLAKTGAGDYVELLAQVAVVASLNPCADELFGASAFEVAPVRAAVRAATPAERPLLVSARRRGRLGGAQPLTPDPGFQPRHGAVTRREFEIELPDSARARLDALHRRREYGDSDGEILRAVLFRWWQQHHASSDPPVHSGK